MQVLARPHLPSPGALACLEGQGPCTMICEYFLLACHEFVSVNVNLNMYSFDLKRTLLITFPETEEA